MSNTERNATRRSEIGLGAGSDLAVETLADGPRRSANLLSMTEVSFPVAIVSIPEFLAALYELEGRQVSVALGNGSRIDGCQLVSAPRAGAKTVWLFSNGVDVFVELSDVADIWEVACTARAA